MARGLFGMSIAEIREKVPNPVNTAATSATVPTVRTPAVVRWDLTATATTAKTAMVATAATASAMLMTKAGTEVPPTCR